MTTGTGHQGTCLPPKTPDPVSGYRSGRSHWHGTSRPGSRVSTRLYDGSSESEIESSYSRHKGRDRTVQDGEHRVSPGPREYGWDFLRTERGTGTTGHKSHSPVSRDWRLTRWRVTGHRYLFTKGERLWSQDSTLDHDWKGWKVPFVSSWYFWS